MSELKRVDEDLPPEAAALARALRDLFQGLGISMRRYAARRSYDNSAVSRFLSGQRLPPWEFVLNLLHDVAEERGTVPTEETIAMLRDLRSAALRAGDSPVHTVQLLQQRLAEADQEARRAAMRERLLEDTLQDREHRIRDLQIRHRELQASVSDGLGDATPSGEASDEHARLHAEIHDLQAELTRVRALHRRAEERCEQLERQLVDAERAAGRAGDLALLPEVFLPNARDGGTAGGGASGVFGQNTTIHGDVNVITGGWQVDEEYVASMTVQVVSHGSGSGGNGLLVDAETVVTLGYVVNHGVPELGFQVTVRNGERTAQAVVVEAHSVTHQGYEHHVVALRLPEPFPFPDRPLTADLRPSPGSQLLVSGYTHDGPYSCLLDVKGRTGGWLRVSGELVNDIGGAPAFSGTGELAGLVGSRMRDRDLGHVLPASALLALAEVDIAT